MIMFARYDANGRYTWYGNAGSDTELNEPGVYVGLVDIYRQYHDVATNQPVNIPAKPSPNHVFDYALKQWVDPRTLDQIKAAQWELIKAARDAAEFSSFVWDGSEFDADALSQQRIIGAAQLAEINPAFEIDWTLADNSVRTLNAAQMKSVGTALGAHVNAQHVKARGLRTQIENATTRAEVEAVTW